MANNRSKKNKNSGRGGGRNQPTPKSSPAASKKSLKDQVARFVGIKTEVDGLSDELGKPDVPKAPAEPSGATLEETLRSAEGVLATVRSHLGNARDREKAAKDAETRLAKQKRDHEETVRKAKREASAEHKARIEGVEESEQELLSRLETCESRESAIAEAEAEARTAEARLTELKTKLTERELNAEQGFIAEKVRVLEPLEEDVGRLREERAVIEAEVRDGRSTAATEARNRTEERAADWAKNDDQRAKDEAEARRLFDEDMAATRKGELSKLRVVLQDERAQAEADWEKELTARRDRLDSRASELDEREEEVAAEAKKLRRGRQDLEADGEILAEDRAAIDNRVQRLITEGTEDLRHEVASLGKQLKDARARRDAHFTDLESRRELDRRFGHRTPEQILGDLTGLERERDELAQQLRDRPDAGAAERLAELERARSAWLENHAVLEADLAQARAELASRRLAAIELETLRKQKEALDVHKQLLGGELEELRATVDELTMKEDHRNPMTALTSLDDDEELKSEVRTTAPTGRAIPTLRDFVTDLRHRIATGVEGRTLYYTERDIRSFLGGLAMTRLLLLQGLSGTGKTSLPLAFASAVRGGIEVVKVQAGWRDRQDLVGYYNAFHRHYYASNFLQALYRAGTPAYKDRLFMMVLDEINLSRPEQFFADFLSELEQPIQDRKLTLVDDPVSNAPDLMVKGRHLPIPPNVWFVGTANHDETTAEFADKTYDRAHMMEIRRVGKEAHFDVEDKNRRNPLSYDGFQKMFSDAAEKQGRTIALATSWLQTTPIADTLARRFRVGWGNRLEDQLSRYVPVVVEAGGTVGEAMDHLLETKVFRKLKDRHDVRAAALEELQVELLTSWDKLDKSNPPERCNALIETEIEAKKGEDLV